MNEVGLSGGVLVISKSGTTSLFTNARNDLLEVGLAGVIRRKWSEGKLRSATCEQC